MEVISHPRHAVNIAPVERWASAIGGGLLATIGFSRQSWYGLALGLVGGELVRRGITGHSYWYENLGIRTAPLGQGAETTSVPYELGIRVDWSITVRRPRHEVYRVFRDVENLPYFAEHVQSVRPLSRTRSHWVVKAPAGKTVEWDAEIHNEIADELIGWRSLPGANVAHAGSLQFGDAPDGRGTDVRVELQYNPPGGILGAFAAKMWGQEPTQQIAADFERLKRMLEAGEAAAPRRDAVEEASEESFPASDAPAMNP